MALLSTVLPAQTTFAHDAPTIVPTHVDFDASQAPTLCNDRTDFLEILANWIPSDVLTPQGERQLIVRIRRAPTGAKLVDLKLLDANEVTQAEDHSTFSAKTECHLVFYQTAHLAARLLGAFDKPPPPEPCPSCPLCPIAAPSSASGTSAHCPVVFTALLRPRRTFSALPIRRFFLGAGVFLGMTTKPEVHPGAALSLGFVPFSGVPNFRVEFDGVWMPRNAPRGSYADTIPIFVSVCQMFHGLRLCGGLATAVTFVDDAKNDRDFTPAASLRIGAEFNIAGPFSIRTDVFALLPLTQRTALDSPNPLAAGAVAMGMWSFK